MEAFGELHFYRVLVPLDGSDLAEAVLFPAATLSAALSAPVQGALHLMLVLTGEDSLEARASEYIEANMQEALAYLQTVAQRFKTGETYTDARPLWVGYLSLFLWSLADFVLSYVGLMRKEKE